MANEIPNSTTTSGTARLGNQNSRGGFLETFNPRNGALAGHITVDQNGITIGPKVNLFGKATAALCDTFQSAVRFSKEGGIPGHITTNENGIILGSKPNAYGKCMGRVADFFSGGLISKLF